jgi:hypothetical protein
MSVTVMFEAPVLLTNSENTMLFGDAGETMCPVAPVTNTLW